MFRLILPVAKVPWLLLEVQFNAFMNEREIIQKLDGLQMDLSSLFFFLKQWRETPFSSPIKTKASYIMFSAETGLSETLLGPG